MKFIENILNRPINYGLRALYHKEMRDHIRSRRMIIVLLVIFLTSFASLYGALTSIDTTSGNHDYLYLLLFTTSGSSIPSFLTFIALLGPFVGLSLGFDGIIGEKSERTLYRLTASHLPGFHHQREIPGGGLHHLYDGIFHGRAGGGRRSPHHGAGPSGEELAQNLCVPPVHGHIHLLLAGAQPVFLRDLQERGHLGHGSHRHLADSCPCS